MRTATGTCPARRRPLHRLLNPARTGGWGWIFYTRFSVRKQIGEAGCCDPTGQPIGRGLRRCHQKRHAGHGRNRSCQRGRDIDGHRPRRQYRERKEPPPTPIRGLLVYRTPFPGTYTVTEQTPSNYSEELSNIGNDGGKALIGQTQGITLTNGAAGTGYDFSNIPGAGDHHWLTGEVFDCWKRIIDALRRTIHSKAPGERRLGLGVLILLIGVRMRPFSPKSGVFWQNNLDEVSQVADNLIVEVYTLARSGAG